MPAQRYSIVGSNFAKADDFIRTMKGGEELALVREPLNKYDKNAIAVYCGAQKIGYVPKTHNVVLAKFIDAKGEPWKIPDASHPALASDAAQRGDLSISARFVRSPNSAFPQAEVA